MQGIPAPAHSNMPTVSAGFQLARWRGASSRNDGRRREQPSVRQHRSSGMCERSPDSDSPEHGSIDSPSRMAEPLPTVRGRGCSTGSQKFVLERFATWLLLSMGIVALASPALACGTLTAAVRDCCPEGAPSPCKGGVPPANATCCVSAPVVTQAAAVVAQRPAHVPPSDNHGPNPLVLAAWVHSLDLATRASVPVQYVRARPGGADQQIYLQTRRLRL